MKCSLSGLCLIMALVTVYGKKGFGPGEQDWDYVTVRPNAYMFWWLYETTANVVSPVERPLIIWLQGGPGASSTGFGNFAEIGPLNLNLTERNYTWVKDYNVLFIDNPVGTGFSYVSVLSALTTTNKQIAQDLVTCLDGFLDKHSEFRYVPLYVVAESYGGKMAVEFALELHKRIKTGNNEANLRGISLIDSWISPIDSVLNWAPYLLNIGAVDQHGYDQIAAGALKVEKAINLRKFEVATREWARTENIISSITGGIDFYNILTKTRSPVSNAIESAEDIQLDNLMNGLVKEALGIKNVTFGKQSNQVFAKQQGDFMRPVTSQVEEILNSTDIKVQIITGQLDLIVETPGTLKWVDRLRFPKNAEHKRWSSVPRKGLAVNGVLEGYYKTLDRFSLYWVNRAGHMVPTDNPDAMEVILERLVNN